MVNRGSSLRRGRQKRPRVPEALRKRASQACLPCRQHKEKCGGGVPCTRCQQYRRTCRFEDIRQVPETSQRVRRSSGELPAGWTEKEQQMKRIINHFLGNISFETEDLRRIADTLDHDYQAAEEPNESEDQSSFDNYALVPLSTSTMHYSGELSHWNFSKMLERRLQSLGDRIEGTEDSHTKGVFRATGLQSSSSCVHLAKMYFPPRNVAEFLTDTFLEYAQTNYFYFDKFAFRQKLEFYYSTEQRLTINDAGWICTLLMTFAIGTQFAYMQTDPASATSPSPDDIPDDHVGLELYRFSCRLIPDLITIASVETVQAFLLMGVYTLPIDTSGLAYTYYGLAIKMAIQNGMHRRFSGDDFDRMTIELRNRLWWSAYSLESQISILHGRPVSVSPAEIDTPMPADLPAIWPGGRVFNLDNYTATIFLSSQLVKVSDLIKSLRRCRRDGQLKYLQQLASLRDRLCDWWASLPAEIRCQEQGVILDRPIFRSNVHLELYYTTMMIYMGRPFIFSQTASHNTSNNNLENPKLADIVKSLRTDSLNAAIRTIELCQHLQDSAGLARVSYTEFNACRVALLALIAHSLNEPTNRVSNALTQGMRLIRQMCVGLESAKSEVAVIEALERARRRLYGQKDVEENTATNPESGYDQFHQWAKLWRADPLRSGAIPGSTNLEPLAEHESVPSFDGFFSSFPNELNEFASIPWLDQDFSVIQSWIDDPQTGDPQWGVDHQLM